MMSIYKYFLIFFMLIVASANHAQENSPTIISPYQMKNYDQIINTIYKTILTNDQKSLSERIIGVSNYFLGEPYLLGALGEGPHGQFDQEPLYRTDQFDCMTFVETVLALSKATNLQGFEIVIKKIRYAQGKVSFLTRNHFTSVDWNGNNQRNGIIKDITNEFGIPYKTTDTVIDKPTWYKTLPVSAIKLLQPVNQQQMQFLLNKFRADSYKVKPMISRTNYIPLTVLFININGYLEPNQKVFDKIPSPSIIEIVRQNYDLRKSIGTHLDITHMGFAIRTSQGLMFREASEINGETMDIPLTHYLLRYYKFVQNPNYIGINIEKINQKFSSVHPTNIAAGEQK